MNSESKQSGQMRQKQMKGGKSFKKDQDITQMQIENSNIEKRVKELTENYNPPLCSACPNRRADRICINKACGPANYMKLICGKCHSNSHSKAKTKPEIVIEEYFTKLAAFINEQKSNQQKNESPSLDLEKLKLALINLNTIREQLASLRSSIDNELKQNISPQLRYSLLYESLTKALTNCEYENIQNQLRSIKKIIIYDQNTFLWTDEHQRHQQYLQYLTILENQNELADKTIQQSFSGGTQIPLTEQSFCKGIQTLFDSQINLSFIKSQIENTKMEANGGIIKLNGFDTVIQQFYINHILDWNTKYKLRFRFSSEVKNYINIGIMPLSEVSKNFMFNVFSDCFFKRFPHCVPTQECDRILRGSNLSPLTKDGTQVEMRIDLKENYLDFSDYPNHEHLNASHENFKLKRSQKYVITIAIYQSQSVIIESFEKISSIN